MVAAGGLFGGRRANVGSVLGASRTLRPSAVFQRRRGFHLKRPEWLPEIGGILKLQTGAFLGGGPDRQKGISRVKFLPRTSSIYCLAVMDSIGREW